ncbi:MAG: YbaK/EbsC family protein, partial [bacterium]|nr:YbaK/EbsC family protein [bacterium]
QFGHMLEAFSYGAPPHGGIAPGIDRLLTCITGEPSLREVIAFPMTSGGRTAVMNAPAPIREDKLAELGISVKQIVVGPSVFDTIKNLLQDHKIIFEEFNHKPVFTSEEAAQVRSTELKLGAKAMILYADNKPLMIVLPSDKKIDLKLFKTTYQIKDLRMATREEVKQVTLVEVGAVPPFGNIFHIPLYVDESIKENEKIVFNAGSHSKSIMMKSLDFIQVSEPIEGSFAK